MSLNPAMRKSTPANKNNPTVNFCNFNLPPYTSHEGETALGLLNLKGGID